MDFAIELHTGFRLMLIATAISVVFAVLTRRIISKLIKRI